MMLPPLFALLLAAPALPATNQVIETVIPESALGSLLNAAAPFDQTFDQDLEILGMSRTLSIKVHLSDPKVHVAPDGIHVTLKYHLTDDSGVVDMDGTATPLLTITPVPSKKMLEARFSHSGVTLPGGIELPLETLVKPIEIPAAISEEIAVGSKNLSADIQVTDVVTEEGRVRLRGTVVFHPKGK
jgi:hypothetical protein